MFGKSNKHSAIDSLIGAGTTIHGNVSFSGGLRIDEDLRGRPPRNHDVDGVVRQSG